MAPPSIVTVGRAEQVASDGLLRLSNGKNFCFVMVKLKKEHKQRKAHVAAQSVGPGTASSSDATEMEVDEEFSAPLIMALENGIPRVEAEYSSLDQDIIVAYNVESHKAVIN